MSNEIRVIDEVGQVANVSQLRSKAFISELSNEDLESIAYTIKALKNPIKNVEDETKKRLINGSQFVHIHLTEANRQLLNGDNDQTKKKFYQKYGLDAFVLKSPTQLKKKFGDVIQEDLDGVVVYEKQSRVKFD
ncbi:hypothetical protein X291_02265 [Oenococcus oeni IOEB_C23]|uniref:phage protein n=1 Tax=Oenococcus oeni TaxID=1247 RepID=UPI00050F8A52|nr:phage protein [Oenococcus oeni]KGH66816.1 hypothetical protein X291_02265 [Oenococcus oeni IOEB_C23]